MPSYSWSHRHSSGKGKYRGLAVADVHVHEAASNHDKSICTLQSAYIIIR